MILGIDEAGRGPWAGPLVVGAVVLGGAAIDGLTDSKKLTKKKRELLYDEIISHALAFATGWVSPHELDQVGMSEALRLATRRAVEQIKVPYQEIIIDGTVNFLADTGKGRYVKTMAKADLLISSVSAASILAKVERDRFMDEQHELYPEYGFSSHAGYGTAKHRQAIEEHGVTPLHRLSFAPLAKYQAIETTKPLADESPRQTTKATGDAAEQVVVDHLESLGHQILFRNWRTKFCEIDIISRYGDELSFVEVKYRKNSKFGDGLEAITPKKLRQMKFAVQVFLSRYPELSGTHQQLMAVSLSGDPATIDQLLPIE